MLYDHPIYQEDLAYCVGAGLPFEKLRGKSVLITGAAGMIGSVLVDALMESSRKYDLKLWLFALARSEKKVRVRFSQWQKDDSLRFIFQDMTQPLRTDQAFDYIIHCASNTHPNAYASDPIGTMLTNFIGTEHLLSHAVRHHLERFVFLSSVEIYGENYGNLSAFHETDCGYIDCNTLRAGYPESKRAGEALCNAYAGQYDIDIVIPRPCRVYGPTLRSTDSKAMSQFLRNGVRREDIVLKSEGTQRYSYCYSADAVRALLTVLLMGERGHAYNIADAKSDITLRELAKEIAGQAGTHVVFAAANPTEAAGFSKVQNAILDGGKLRALGWHAQFPIAEGIERTMRVLRETGWGKEGE